MKIEIPENCPCCNSLLETINSQLFCRNLSCEAQVTKKIENMAKVLAIKGLGPKSLEKLALNDLTELFYLDLDTVSEALGQKVASKLLDEIERAKSADLATFLASMSIPLVGNTASTKIASIVNHIDDISAEKCKEAGLGEKVTANLLNWLETDFVELREFLPFSFKSNNKNISSADGPTVCITGKLHSYKTKAEAYKLLENAGYRISETVTKAVGFLVDEEGKESTKRKKAESLGIPIIHNLNEFLNSKEI